MAINYFFAVSISFLLSIIFIFLFKPLFLRYKVLTFQNIPLIGGIAMGSSFMLTCLIVFSFYGSMSPEIKNIIIASCIMMFFGIFDDWRSLSVLTKFLVQIIAISILILLGIRTQIISIGDLLNIIITFIWVMGITNAFNHLDILDGLAAATAAIASLSLFIIAHLNGNIQVAIFTLAFSGAILGFLIYNFPPAKVYMGNCGSHYLGLILAAIAISISYAPEERKIALASPLLILGLPILDTAFLILMRLKQGQIIFRKTNDHLALRLLKLGYSKNKTLLFMLLLALFFSASGLLVSRVSNLLGSLVIILVVSLSLIFAVRMSKVWVNG